MASLRLRSVVPRARELAVRGRRRLGDVDSPFGRLANRLSAGSELDRLGRPGPIDGSGRPVGAVAPGRADARGPARTGRQPAKRLVAPWSLTHRRVLAPERLAAKPAAHVAAP